MVPSECAPVGFFPALMTSGCHVDRQLHLQMKSPFVSALREYSVRPDGVTSTFLPSACPVSTVVVAANAEEASRAVPRASAVMVFDMPPGSQAPGPVRNWI